MLGLWKTNRGPSSLPIATLFKEFDALKAFKDGTFAADGGARFKAVVLGHLRMR